MADEPGFRLEAYRESIAQSFPDGLLPTLNTIPDFRIGYELNPELNQVLREAGIPGSFGDGGHTPAQWPAFGSVQKTVAEFTAAYNKFRDDMLALFKAAVKPVGAAKPAAARPVAKTAAPKATAARPPARRPAARKIAKAAAKKSGRR
jgi:hypothetical protein